MRARSFTSADGTPLRADFYGDNLGRVTPDSTSLPGLVVLLHGYCEHRGRYQQLAGELEQKGYAVFCGDLRGHGESGGVRAYVERFSDYLDDLAAFLAEAQRAYAEALPATRLAPPQPILVAHSMGALVGLSYVLRDPAAFRSLALSSPFLGIKLKVPGWKRGLGMVASLLKPTLALPNGIAASDVSHDPQVAARYASDPLITHAATARWFTEVLAAHADLRERAGRIRTPIFIMQAGDDRVVDPAATAALFARLGSRDKTLNDYPGLFHELFNESAADRQRVLSDLFAWLASR